MHHHVARTRDHRLAFSSWEEGRALWDAVISATPGRVAVCVMPDHVHVLCPTDVRLRLSAALGGYARRRNRARGLRGALWQPLPEPEAVEGDLKVRRNIRYIHLNPCRAGLVGDPLAWPLCTHMDAVGMALDPVRRRASDPLRFHDYVSGDPSVRVQGTDLPVASGEPAELRAVLDAVSMATRCPLSRLRRRGRARTLAICAMRTLTPASQAEIGRAVDATGRTVRRVEPSLGREVRLIERWVGDPRCAALDAGTLRFRLQGSRYSRARP